MSTSREWVRMQPFSQLSEAGMSLLSSGLSLVDCARSTAVLEKGQPASGAYILLRGRLRVFTIAPNGTEATLYFMEPGEACVLSINCLFNDLLYPAWVQAESDARVAVIPGATYRRLFQSEAVIQNLTVQALSTAVYRLMSELEQVHSSNHRQRLVQFILSQSDSDHRLQMTQQQIAQHLGTTREVIARLIGELVRRRLVRTERGKILIADVQGLRHLGADTSHSATS